ncbi:hypothetical protein TWF730_008292 [Orbilia blumenaviensis]|uniref:Uncharacterized protein n=1 Tax=Orbilia blumenaviensis TaxID=1796055 RepID=A0AAV9V4X9_9PEZI
MQLVRCERLTDPASRLKATKYEIPKARAHMHMSTRSYSNTPDGSLGIGKASSDAGKPSSATIMTSRPTDKMPLFSNAKPGKAMLTTRPMRVGICFVMKRRFWPYRRRRDLGPRLKMTGSLDRIRRDSEICVLRGCGRARSSRCVGDRRCGPLVGYGRLRTFCPEG